MVRRCSPATLAAVKAKSAAGFWKVIGWKPSYRCRHNSFIFGVKYTINLGGPELDGFLQWLKENNDRSPLYMRPDA